MKPLLLLIVSAGALLQAGCLMIPPYARPASPIPPSWPEGPAYGAAPTNAPGPAATAVSWRVFFTDPALRDLIGTALTNNLDLRLAAQNAELASAIYGIRRVEWLPEVSAAASANRQRTPGDLTGSGTGHTSQRYDVNLGVVSWELDLFGRIRSLEARALEEYLASEEARRGAQVALVASVAAAYLNLAADRENLALARTTLEAQTSSYALVKSRFDLGLTPELDLHRARTQVENARGDVARFVQQVAQDGNALVLLAGGPVPDALLPQGLGVVTPPEGLEPGLSSDVLLLRPDVLQAEHLLKAANADIGAARAAFFPRIALTGVFGTASDALSGLFKSGSGAWSFAPQAVLPVFDPRLRAASRAAEVQQRLAVTRYEKAVQDAFRETADTLAVRGSLGEQLAAQEALVAAQEATYRLALSRYNKGIDSYLGVLDAQRSLYAAQRGLVILRLAKHLNQVRLYAVLGGGAGE